MTIWEKSVKGCLKICIFYVNLYSLCSVESHNWNVLKLFEWRLDVIVVFVSTGAVIAAGLVTEIDMVIGVVIDMEVIGVAIDMEVTGMEVAVDMVTVGVETDMVAIGVETGMVVTDMVEIGVVTDMVVDPAMTTETQVSKRVGSIYRVFLES